MREMRIKIPDKSTKRKILEEIVKVVTSPYLNIKD